MVRRDTKHRHKEGLKTVIKRTIMAVLTAGLLHIGMTTLLAAQEEKTTTNPLQELVNLVQQGKWQTALNTARELKAKDPNNAPIIYVAFVASNVIGDYNQPSMTKYDFPFSDNEAMTTLHIWASKLLDDHPKNSNLLILNGILHTQIGDGNTIRLLRYFEQARSIDPNDNFILEILGGAYGKQGKLDLAIQTLKKAIEIRPTSNGYSNLGTILHNQGKRSTAEQCLKKAVELNPHNSEAWYLLGLHYVKRERTQEARQPLEQAVSLTPKMLQARWYLGGIYLFSGQRSEAIEQLKEIISIAPDSTIGQQAKKMLTRLGG